MRTQVVHDGAEKSEKLTDYIDLRQQTDVSYRGKDVPYDNGYTL